MIHPSTQVRYIGPEIGHGVFATAFIPKGTITWAPDSLDREFTPEAFMALPALVCESATTYSYRNNRGHFVLPWDHTRYVNHSQQANAMITPYGFEVAIRDIHSGDEITNDYGTLNIIEAFEPCAEEGGRKVVAPDDLARFYPEWDKLVHEALLFLDCIDQPLAGLLPKEILDKVRRINTGIDQPESLLSVLYCKG